MRCRIIKDKGGASEMVCTLKCVNLDSHIHVHVPTVNCKRHHCSYRNDRSDLLTTTVFVPHTHVLLR